ncbi:MAG TPA: hypothetical protein VGN64_14670, partial [Dyadobacter sp.]|jgi:hypothetical protein|nr:hypothetical protein [Dyadobacter sp.]
MQELQAFVNAGGSVSVIPPSQPDLNSYQTFLRGSGVNGLSVNRDSSVEPLPMTAPDRNNPFFSDVFEESVRQETNLSLPAAAPVWSWPSAGQQLLALRNGQPYLTRIARGKGKVYLFASPFQSEYSSMAQHAIFVPVMYKMAAMSVRAQRTAFTFDEDPIALQIDDVAPNTTFKLRRDKTEIIPVQRRTGNQLLLEIPEGDQLGEGVQAGYFDLMNENKVQQVIALNHNNTESKLEYYSPGELKAAFTGQKNVQVFDSLTDDAFAKEFQQQNLGTSLWKYFLYAALFFLLAEVLLIRFKK